MIQIFFAYSSTNDEIVNLLQAREKAIRANLEALSGDNQPVDEQHPLRHPRRLVPERLRQLWQMTGDYGIAYYEAELRWLQSAIEHAGQLPPLESAK